MERPESVVITAAKRPEGEKNHTDFRVSSDVDQLCEADEQGDKVRQVESKGHTHVSPVQGASGPLSMLMQQRRGKKKKIKRGSRRESTERQKPIENCVDRKDGKEE